MKICCLFPKKIKEMSLSVYNHEELLSICYDKYVHYDLTIYAVCIYLSKKNNLEIHEDV